MAGILYVFASDTGDLETATEAIKIREIGPDVEITRHLPPGGDTLIHPAAELAAAIRDANTRIAAAPSAGFLVDVADDPTVALDPKRLAYTEEVTGASAAPAEVEIIDSAKSLSIAPATAVDLDAALALLGL